MTTRKNGSTQRGLLLSFAVSSLALASVVFPFGEAADAWAAEKAAAEKAAAEKTAQSKAETPEKSAAPEKDAQAKPAPDRHTLRVCGDPNNLPFSNEKLEGIENKLAEVIAKELGWGVEYVWWPHQRGLIRRVLNTERCDVMLGIPKGYDPVRWTKPYYRTGYVIAYQKDRVAEIRSIDDPQLKTLKIGVQSGTPPHTSLARRGLLSDKVVTYLLNFDSNAHPEDYPGKEVEDLLAGQIDVALVYGPIAGYFQRKRGATSLAVVPIEDPTQPIAFDISMGVRKEDTDLKMRLEQVIDKKRDEIRAVLEDFGVPLYPLAVSAPEDAAKKPAGPKHDKKVAK